MIEGSAAWRALRARGESDDDAPELRESTCPYCAASVLSATIDGARVLVQPTPVYARRSVWRGVGWPLVWEHESGYRRGLGWLCGVEDARARAAWRTHACWLLAPVPGRTGRAPRTVKIAPGEWATWCSFAAAHGLHPQHAVALLSNPRACDVVADVAADVSLDESESGRRKQSNTPRVWASDTEWLHLQRMAQARARRLGPGVSRVMLFRVLGQPGVAARAWRAAGGERWTPGRIKPASAVQLRWPWALWHPRLPQVRKPKRVLTISTLYLPGIECARP